MTPFFSIIVPTYNRENIIIPTIESVLSQSYPHYELLIIDDGSTDNTAELVKKYLSDRVFYYKKEHGERSQARNFGTALAKGAYINWLDSDDIMLPGHLEKVRKVLDQYNSPPILGVAYEVERPGNGVVYRLQFPDTILNPYMLRWNFMRTSTGIVRRDIALQFPFNTAAIPQEDHELWLRIGASFDIVSNNEVTIRLVEHPQSGSVMITRDGNEYAATLERLIKEVSSSRSVRSFFKNRLSQFKMYRYACGAYFLATHGLKRVPTKLLLRSISSHPLIFFRKEFYAAVKHLLFTYR